MELRKENTILVSPEPIKHPCSRVDKIAFIDMGEARSVNNLKWLRNVQSPKKAGQKYSLFNQKTDFKWYAYWLCDCCDFGNTDQ